MNESLVIWAALLLGVAVVLFFVEIFLPTHGLISLVAAVALVAGIVMLFRVDTTIGLVGALASLVAVPLLMVLAVKLWPQTPIGRMLTLGGPHRLDGNDRSNDGLAAMVFEPLVGDKGTAVTDLRPVGTCVIRGRRTECLAETGVIRGGAAVTVVSVDGMQVKVREG